MEKLSQPRIADAIRVIELCWSNEGAKPLYRRPLGALLAISIMLSSAVSNAQSSTSSLQGVVNDASGAVVVGAYVEIKNSGTGGVRNARSSQDGRFTLPLLTPGIYSLSATSPGFATVKIPTISLAVNSTITLNITFEKLADVAQTVSVVAEAEALNTTDASVGNAFGTRPILQLPLEARNVAGLLALQPGVTFLADDASDGRFRDQRNGAVNGARSDQSNVTLDGVDVNDQSERLPFTSVLRTTLDSVQEFRVTTTGANADQGRSSGAQVSLVTKGGSNQLHGSIYHFHRNTVTTANDFFNNRIGLARPKLIRNIFGASLGGPIRKNRLFYFANYEGRRDASEQAVLRIVPTQLFKSGTIRYLNTSGGTSEISPARLRELDPQGRGWNPAVQQVLSIYPNPNDTTVGYGVNSNGLRFTAATPLRWNTWISRLDWAVDNSGKHNMFLRGNLQNDKVVSPPQLPGQAPASDSLANNKGLAFGYTAVLSSNFVSSFRYGFTRQGTERTGAQTSSLAQWNTFIAESPVATTRGLTAILPVQSFNEDLTWTKGRHSLQFGGAARVIRNSRSNFATSFNSAAPNPALLADPNEVLAFLPGVSPLQQRNDTFAVLGALGVLNGGTGSYNYDLAGNVQAEGSPVLRRFGGEEYETYFQDTWRARPNLTIIAGLRWLLMPPVREVNGVQVSVLPAIGDWLAARDAAGDNGFSQTTAGRISYVPISDQSARSLYPFAKSNFSPRLSLAYSPRAGQGWLRSLLGAPGRSAVRAGFGLFYDVFGMGLMQTLDANALGLSSSIAVPNGRYTLATAPRMSSPFVIPAGLIPAAPKGGPGEAPNAFASATVVDHGIRAPYTMNLNFLFSRDLGAGWTIETGYVGRLSRATLSRQDAATFTNYRDPASGQSYYEAIALMAPGLRANAAPATIGTIPFFENLWPNLAGSGLTATQAVYQNFRAAYPNFRDPLANIDHFCRPACSPRGANLMVSPQYSSLAVTSSIGNGNYHAMQLTARKRFSAGYQMDLNYTWSKSIDLFSAPERGVDSYTFITNTIVNTFDRSQQRAVSDYDMTHQLNVNWVAELPFGQGTRFLKNAPRPLNVILGGWQLSGIMRLSSGLPLFVDNQPGRSTVATYGYAQPLGVTPRAGVYADRNVPGLFEDPIAARKAFRWTIPGESGVRNSHRGDGLFNIDIGLAKRFALPWEGHSVQLRGEAFNVSNTVTFSPNNASLNSLGAQFGVFSNTLSRPRVLQFGLRYEF